MERPESNNLNPQITDVEIGVRDLRNVKIYPLAVGPQLKMEELIKSSLQEFFKIDQGREESLDEFVSYVIRVITDNMGKMLALVALDEKLDDKKAHAKFLNEVTNYQLSQIAVEVYKANFDSPVKNVLSLFPQGIGSLLKRQSQAFANPTGTSPEDSTEQTSSPEELPSEK